MSTWVAKSIIATRAAHAQSSPVVAVLVAARGVTGETLLDHAKMVAVEFGVAVDFPNFVKLDAVRLALPLATREAVQRSKNSIVVLALRSVENRWFLGRLRLNHV